MVVIVQGSSAKGIKSGNMDKGDIWGAVFFVETKIILLPSQEGIQFCKYCIQIIMLTIYKPTIIRVSTKKPSTHSEITLPYVS